MNTTAGKDSGEVVGESWGLGGSRWFVWWHGKERHGGAGMNRLLLAVWSPGDGVTMRIVDVVGNGGEGCFWAMV